MPVNNPRIKRWVEKLRQIEIETQQKTRIRPRKAWDKKRYSRFSTQMIRRDIVRGLRPSLTASDLPRPAPLQPWSRAIFIDHARLVRIIYNYIPPLHNP